MTAARPSIRRKRWRRWKWGDPLSPDEERHREELSAHLREHGGNVSAVARTLGKARVQIQRWIKRYGLHPDSFRS